MKQRGGERVSMDHLKAAIASVCRVSLPLDPTRERLSDGSERTTHATNTRIYCSPSRLPANLLNSSKKISTRLFPFILVLRYDPTFLTEFVFMRK